MGSARALAEVAEGNGGGWYAGEPCRVLRPSGTLRLQTGAAVISFEVTLRVPGSDLPRGTKDSTRGRVRFPFFKLSNHQKERSCRGACVKRLGLRSICNHAPDG